ncbi:hypothetical protein ASZ90_014391 [hydrocarbon metagenome]|jgi:hypothetical protein|uniref:Uncharacterized protein n=1 Tax=hydrocarbon metagenome TaxID=938273 RepID=A0A0W8F4S7_9ZZZZ
MCQGKMRNRKEVMMHGYYVPNICDNSLWSNGGFIALGIE